MSGTDWSNWIPGQPPGQIVVSRKNHVLCILLRNLFLLELIVSYVDVVQNKPITGSLRYHRNSTCVQRYQ